MTDTGHRLVYLVLILAAIASMLLACEAWGQTRFVNATIRGGGAGGGESTNFWTLSTDRLPGGTNWSVDSVGVESGNFSVTALYTNISPPSSATEINAALVAASALNQRVGLRAGFFNLDAVVDMKANTELLGTATGIAGFSDSSVSVGTGSKSWRAYPNAGFTVGDIVRGYDGTTTNNYVQGDVTTYTGTNLVINVTSVAGSGTVTQWYFFKTNWTVLLGTGGGGFVSGIVRFAGPFVDPPSVTPLWTGGKNQGATNITVDSATGLAVGELVGLDRINDTLLDVTNAETFLSRDSGTRSQGQIVQLKAISGNNLTISHPVLMTNYAGGTPELYRIGAPMTNAGVGNLCIWNVDKDNADSNIYFQGAWNCWATNVHSIGAELSHVRTYQCARIEVRRCSFMHTEQYASQSYGVNLTFTGFSLVEDCLFDVITSPILIWGAGTAGNVIAYNYATNGGRYSNSPAFMVASYFTHGAHPHMNLWEGNVGNAIVYDFEHGSASHNLAFRNNLEGFEVGSDLYKTATKTTHTYPAQQYTRNRFISWAGNILGTDGYHTGYRLESVTSSADDNKSIFRSGYKFSYISDTNYYDFTATNTLILASNWNTVTAGVPAAETTNTTLRPSMFRSSKPAFFGALAWPPFSPDGIRTNLLPAEARHRGIAIP